MTAEPRSVARKAEQIQAVTGRPPARTWEAWVSVTY